VVVHLRGEEVQARAQAGGRARARDAEGMAMRTLATVFASRRRYEAAQRAGRLARGPLHRATGLSLPGPLAGWTLSRDLPEMPAQSFRDWWRERR